MFTEYDVARGILKLQCKTREFRATSYSVNKHAIILPGFEDNSTTVDTPTRRLSLDNVVNRYGNCLLDLYRQVLHTPCPEIWHGQLHMYFSGLKENLCSCFHLKSQALNLGTRSMKYIVHGLSYVDIIQKKIGT